MKRTSFIATPLLLKLPKPCHLFTLLLIWVFSTGCDSGGKKTVTTPENEAPYTIRLAEAEDNKGEVFLSDFAKSITYIQLESSTEHLIAGNPRFYLAGDHVFSTAFRQIYVFDKASGRFVREVRRFGEGPDEYRNTSPWIHINENKQAVYARNPRNKRIALDINGQEQLIFATPAGDSTFTSNVFPLAENLYVGYHANYDCNQKLKLILFDENGNVVKTYKNGLTCINEHPNRISFNTREGLFYDWEDHVFFKESFNDTLYRVSETSLDFHAVFVNEDFSLPYEQKTSLITPEDTAPYFEIGDLDETADFIFFSLMHKGEQHSAYYNKQKNETRVAYNETTELNQFTNDLDDFIPFSPQYATADGKLVGYLEAPYVIEWFEMNPEKAARLPESLRRFENMDEDDNPILMIVDTKN